MSARLSDSAYATPRSLHERHLRGQAPAAEMHVLVPHGKGSRAVVVELNRRDLLVVIANAADALRLLDQDAS